MSRVRRLAPLAVAAALTLGISACGSSSKSPNGSSTPAQAKNGGTLTVLDVAGGIDSLDPGYWYYQSDYSDMWQPTQRSLYGWPDSDNTAPIPDLATALPVATDGGKTLTIHIKPGIHYSAPLQNQTVTSQDVAYGLTRCLMPKIGNGYAGAYFTNIVGASAMLAGKATSAAGIQTPDSSTLVLKLTTITPVLQNANALSLPCTVPVPKAYAAKYDKGAASTYGMHQVFTGPYMIEGAGTGTVPASGYTPQKILDLVRNPQFDQASDPIVTPHLDEIVIKEGYTSDVASRDVLTGTGMVSGDYAAPPPDIAAQYLHSKASQWHVAPAQSIRYIAMNPKFKPFNNINARKAIIAVTNRNALILTRGGAYIGKAATHWIAPGMPGFDQAGGYAGPGNDYYANPNGNLALAESYMKKAGYPSGKYTGPPLLMVADNASPAKQTAEAFATQIAQIGFKVNLQEVPHATMYSKFCNVPKNQPPLCPNLAWGKDFYDTQSYIAPLFYGPNIAQSGNTNTAQLNNPAINSAIAKANVLTDPTARANAYAAIDRTVTAGAYYDNWIWDNEAQLRSANVNAPYNDFNTDTDLADSSLQ